MSEQTKWVREAGIFTSFLWMPTLISPACLLPLASTIRTTRRTYSAPTGQGNNIGVEALGDTLPIAPVDIHSRVAYFDALNDGRSVEELQPNGKAAEEIRALYKWLIKV
jgi:hypothetical protein